MIGFTPRFGVVDFKDIKLGQSFVDKSNSQKRVVEINGEPKFVSGNEAISKQLYSVKVKGLPYNPFIIVVKDRSGIVSTLDLVNSQNDQFIKKEPLKAFKEK